MVKQRMKRALLMLVGVMTMWLAHAETIVTVGGLQYSLSGAYASVYRVAEGNTSEQIDVPATISYEGLTYIVNEIGNSAFYIGSSSSYNKYVKRVQLPNTIEVIGKYAFANNNITKITLREGVERIRDNAFSNSSITELVIPSSVKRMSDYTYGTDLSYYAFYGCDKLRTLIYLGVESPMYWTATSQTYVPTKENYNDFAPLYSMNNASIIEMITFAETSFSYTGNPPTPSWTNNMEGYSVNFTMPTLKKDVGTYEEIIPVTITKDGESYVAQVPYKYTIEPVKLTAKVSNISRTYGEPNPSFNITYSGFVNGDNENVLTTKPTATTTATETSAVGTYPITLSGGEAKNYTIEYVQGELTVNKASLAIQVKDSQKVYGSINPAFTLNYSGLKNNETAPEWMTAPQFTTAATKESGAGTYIVNVTCNPKNYAISSNTPGTLTITKAPLTIKVENATMDYCGIMPTYNFVYSGFVNGDNASSLSTLPSVSTTATIQSNAGTYTITPTGAISPNYDFTYTPGILTIKQRPLTVKAQSVSRLYGENNPTFIIEYNGFVNNETKSVLDIEPTATTTATVQSNAGTYDIRVSGGRAVNYELIYQAGQLTIAPRALKAYVGNYERPYGENNPVFTIIYEGLVGNDTGNSLSPAPIARTTATKTSDVGTYDIEVTGGYSPNYILSYGSGKLVIVKAEQDFDWDQDLSNLKVGDQILLTAYASSGLQVTYTMDSEKYAEIYTAGSKTYIECKAPGTFMTKAVQNGNNNYFSTQRINKEVSIVSGGEYKPTLNIRQANNGMVSMKVEKGSSKTFNIYSDSGWKIHSVTFNGEDVTNKLVSNSSYTTPAINENSTLNVVYEQVNNALNTLHLSGIKILPTSTGIKVIGATIGDVIQIYTINGILQRSVHADSTEMEILLNKDNVYIIKVGTSTMKLSL